VRVHQHRPVAGVVKTITVKREGRRWHVVLACDGVLAEPLPATGRQAGVDLGVASFVTTSDGEHVPNSRYLKRAAGRLATAQRVLARRQRGSTRRRRARERIAPLHAKVQRQRLDHAHKTALGLVRAYDLLAHEDLKIARMTRSASGTAQQPGSNVTAKAGLNRSIHDAGWGMFLRVLAAAAESAQRELIAVNPANTSRTCPQCGHCAAGNRVTQASFRCVACGFAGDADVVAASNILRAGLALRDPAQAA
jgi:putative transposase